MSRNVLPILGAAAVMACTDIPVNPTPATIEGRARAASLSGAEQKYVVLAKDDKLPDSFAADVAAAGGIVLSSYPDAGIAVVSLASSSSANELSRASWAASVTEDVVVQWVDPDLRAESVEDLSLEEAAPLAELADAITPTTNPLFSLQWAPQAIQAPEAWSAGYTGSGVRVAIIDGGIHSTHVDLAPNLDIASSRSFTTGAFNTDLGTVWHGTHVAGIVAAVSNNVGVVGIAPNATLIGVKVMHGGAGNVSTMIDGIMYAATPKSEGGAGAHVINISLGATIQAKLKETNPVFRELKKSVDRASKYAWEHGVVVVTAAGNGALDFDADRSLFQIPAQNQHVISVAATGPHGWALSDEDRELLGTVENEAFERPTNYTNFGESLVDLAAPGGTVGLLVVDGIDRRCTMRQTTGAAVTTFCETFDRVLSTVRANTVAGNWGWLHGTSMAAPMVAGVAALVIERHGGTLSPAAVRTRVQQGAIDHGKPGRDEFYGMGWVNALGAVR